MREPTVGIVRPKKPTCQLESILTYFDFENSNDSRRGWTQQPALGPGI
jgi:hypothetical protein